MLRAVNKCFSARPRSGRTKTLRPGARCRWWSARQRRSVAVSPDYPEPGRVQWDRGIPQAQLHRAEDMPRKPVAGKARRRIGHWGDPLPNDDDEPPGERGRSGKSSCRTARRTKAGGKRSAQPGMGEGVRIEARRGKTWQLHRQGLIHESRPRRGTHDQFNPRCCAKLHST